MLQHNLIQLETITIVIYWAQDRFFHSLLLRIKFRIGFEWCDLVFIRLEASSFNICVFNLKWINRNRKGGRFQSHLKYFWSSELVASTESWHLRYLDFTSYCVCVYLFINYKSFIFEAQELVVPFLVLYNYDNISDTENLVSKQ